MNRFEKIFGKESKGTTAEERAKSSKIIFVRSQDELAIYSNGAKGSKLTAWEAFKTFGIDVLEEAVDEGSAILVCAQDEPAKTFQERRENLGLTQEDIAKYCELTNEEVADIENPKKKNPIQKLKKLAQYLGLDEREITFKKGFGGDKNLAIRLKSLSCENKRLNPKTVISFNEAAWVFSTETRLKEWLGLRSNSLKEKFVPSKNYGFSGHPAWEMGYNLAEDTRKILGLNNDEPINSLRELCIKKLSLPLLQCELPRVIAGATIANDTVRGIVVNTAGRNGNVWVRRATIAHELGHLLWDPEQQLERIRVDSYEELDSGLLASDGVDYVEQRANAFAAEFLAPKDAVFKIYKKNGLRTVMEHFGISYTVARYQAWNGSHRTEEIESFTADSFEPTDEWMGRDSFTADYFPIRNAPKSRTEYFAYVVVMAEKQGLISEDTASSYLSCSREDYNSQKSAIEELFQND
ncbi:MAG: XRE family transcriptional regulator [Deltaproteobacteria bacterium]|nr:XRE family transcriptional regulator [Deltaproteobacteria bacterium]